MSMIMRKTVVALGFALAMLLVSTIPADAQSNQYSLRMENNTGYDIYQVRISSVSNIYWERDLLGVRVFENGTSFTITQISPGSYDLAFVDQDGDTCVIYNVAIFSNLSWDLSRSWLLNCERRW